MELLTIFWWLFAMIFFYHLTKRLVLWSIVNQIQGRHGVNFVKVEDLSIGVSGVSLYKIKLHITDAGQSILVDTELITVSSSIVSGRLGLLVHLNGVLIEANVSNPLISYSSNHSNTRSNSQSQIINFIPWLAGFTIEDLTLVLTGQILPPDSTLTCKIYTFSVLNNGYQPSECVLPVTVKTEDLSAELTSNSDNIWHTSRAQTLVKLNVTTQTSFTLNHRSNVCLYNIHSNIQPKLQIHEDFLQMCSKITQKLPVSETVDNNPRILDAVNIMISKLNYHMISNDQSRNISLDVNLFEIQSDKKSSTHKSDKLQFNTLSKIILEGVDGRCGRLKFVFIKEFKVSAPIIMKETPRGIGAVKDAVSAVWMVESDVVYFEYLQSHVQYWRDSIFQYKWIPVIHPHGDSSREIKKSSDQGESEKGTAVCSSLPPIKIKLTSLQISSTLLDHVGFVSGVDHLDLFIQPNHQVDVNLSRLYSCTKKCPQKPSEINSRQHSWETIIYCHQLQLKMIKDMELNSVRFYSEVDNIRMEWSVDLVQYIIETVDSILPYYHEYKNSRLVNKTDSETDTSTTDSNPEIEEVHLDLTDVTLFTSNQRKVCLMTQLKQLTVTRREDNSKIQLHNFILVYLHQTDEPLSLESFPNSPNIIAQISLITANLNFNRKRLEVSCAYDEPISLIWSKETHMCAWVAVQDGLQLRAKLNQLFNINGDEEDELRVSSKSAVTEILNYSLEMRASFNITAILTTEHSINLELDHTTIKLHKTTLSVNSNDVTMNFDHNPILNFQKFKLVLSDEERDFNLARSSFTDLQLNSNKTISVKCEMLKVRFPHRYDFHSCFDQLINTIRWLKLVMNIKRQPFTVYSPLPRDVRIRINNIIFSILDDPFEVKLGDNYALMMDESRESFKRKQAMDSKVEQLRAQHKFLQGDQLSDLYNSLQIKNSEIYVRRSIELYRHDTPTDRNLFKIELSDLEIFALSDTSLNGTENVRDIINKLDKHSPVAENTKFSSLFARVVSVSLDRITFSLRDYPLPLINVTSAKLWGKLVGAETTGYKRAIRQRIVDMESPWDNAVIERNMCPLKFYHDFSLDTKGFEITLGVCWENTIAQVNQAFQLIHAPSVDPSRRLSWWDKSRLLVHGSLVMSIEEMRWTYPVSFDPYNTKELIDWRWRDAVLEWTNGRWVICGDLTILALTESMFSELELLYAPDFKLTVLIDWLCHGDKNNHHDATPCAPENIPEFSSKEHDSYRAFRSYAVDLRLKLECKQTLISPNRKPSSGHAQDSSGHAQDSSEHARLQFYLSTLRFLNMWRTCMSTVTRPTKSGALFEGRRTMKQKLTRHIRRLSLELRLPVFEIKYMMSHTLNNGLTLNGGKINLNAQLEQSLVQPTDPPELNDPTRPPSRRRLQSNWSVCELSFDLSGCSIYLTSSPHHTAVKSQLVTVSKLQYKRRSHQIQDSQEKALHRLEVHDSRIQWTKHNRNVVFSMYETIQRHRDMTKNLSSNVLKTSTQTREPKTLNTKSRSSSILGSSASKSTSSETFRELLQHLISDSETRFVVHSEDSEPANMSEQLRGVILCQRNDVTSNHLQVELKRTQVRLHGCEVDGYFLVTASKATINQHKCQHIWHAGELHSKTTWITSVEGMQYFSNTQTAGSSQTSQPIWISGSNIEIPTNTSHISAEQILLDRINTSQPSSGSVLTEYMEMPSGEKAQIHFQRVIPRCKCQLFYVSYGSVDMKTIDRNQITAQNESGCVLECEEGIDTFTLLHHDVSLSTNSDQYKQVLDIVNNLVLYIEPTKKQLTTEIEEKRFALQLSNKKSQPKAPILDLQAELRVLQSTVRQLNKDWYRLNNQELSENESEHHRKRMLNEIELEMDEIKSIIQNKSRELNILVSCYNQLQLYGYQAERAAGKLRDKILESRRNEVCFMHARWTLNGIDGQINLADITLRNFTYTKVNFNDDSCAHQLELGWVEVNNQMPLSSTSPFKKVLEVQERRSASSSPSKNRLLLRVYCKNKSSVGGIAVHEHFEVNVDAITLQVSHSFYTTIMEFFFSGGNNVYSTTPPSTSTSQTSISSASGVKRNDSVKTPSRSSVRGAISSDSQTDIEIMRERASRNQLFCYIKCSQVQLNLSYKGRKEKDIKNITNYSFITPELEYRNLTFTWRDLVTKLKSDIQRELVPQAMSQKLGMKSKFYQLSGQPEKGIQDEQKKKLLLGDLVAQPQDSKTSKKGKKGLKSDYS